jgi:hypothetical protein
MITSVLHGIWRWCPLHQLLAKVDLPASLKKALPMIDRNYGVGAGRPSAGEGESTLLPMLIAGLVAVVIGITVAAFFV